VDISFGIVLGMHREFVLVVALSWAAALVIRVLLDLGDRLVDDRSDVS
jgi:hypothetical protein